MCLEVRYHCICGVVASTQLIACVASIDNPNEENHQLQVHNMVLPRQEWAARQGQCFQEGCAQNDASTIGADPVKCPGCSTLITQGETPAELTVDNAKFLDRSLWDAHRCPVEYCPFNVESMARADEDFVTMALLMQQVPEYPEWTAEDDQQILSISRLGGDAELIAATVGRELADVQDRLDYLSLFEDHVE